MYFRVIDFEASGEKPDGEVIELGWVDVWGDHIDRPVSDHSGSLLIRPTRPISIETMAVHHLTEKMLENGTTRDAAFEVLQRFPDIANNLLGELDACYVAHSAKFEQEWFPEAKLPWICTYKCALTLWPESPTHSNQGMRYFLGLDLPPERAMPPHRAMPDAYVTAHILKKMLDRATPQELIEWSSKPALLPRCTFGDNRGKPWSELDDGLLHWTLGKDFSEDVLYTVRHELDRREKEREAAYAGEPTRAEETEEPW